MAFKKRSTSNIAVTSPEGMLHDIRSKKIEGPLARQADIWREYTDTSLDLPDVAIRLPTGSGKTLVGIVLGEWRRRKFSELVVYLCPTNQLVHQVAEQARDVYGIDVVEFTGSKKHYSLDSKTAYRRREKIAITSYSALFNSYPFFENPDIIILDDAHASENYIASMWSFEVQRNSENDDIFRSIVAVLDEHCDGIDLGRAKRDLDADSIGWVEKIPTILFYKCIDMLRAVVDPEIGSRSIGFEWNRIKDHLSACHCYISATHVLIRPMIPPTFSHSPFASAKQRIYMSATLGNGGDLERLTGRKSIHRLSPDSLSNEQGIGRRFFIFPEMSLAEDEAKGFVFSALNLFNRGLFISPSFSSANHLGEEIQKLGGYRVYDANEIEHSKNAFVSEPRAAAVIANRYDGMDFPHEQCRLLVLDGLPRTTNLQEKFLMSRMGCNSLYNDRIQTRIIQAVGRCTRANSDYAAVIILGNEWVDYLLTKANSRYLHPEIQAELDFGDLQSSGSSSEMLENLGIFLKQGSDWQEANEEIIRLRGDMTMATAPEIEDLNASVPSEVEYMAAMWKGDFVSAFDRCRDILGAINHMDLRGYRAFWSYLAGSAIDLGALRQQFSTAQQAKEYYGDSMRAITTSTWIVKLAKSLDLKQESGNNSDPSLIEMVDNMESRFFQYGLKNNRKYEQAMAIITSNLSKDEAKAFENGHLELGRAMGFDCGNAETSGAPDPWWLISSSLCIVFEDHSDAKNNVLSVSKARQVDGHDNWVRDNVEGLAKDAEIIKVLVTSVKTAEPAAVSHLQDVYIVPLENFRSWSNESLRLLASLRSNLTAEGDMIWRVEAMAKLEEGARSPSQVVRYFKKIRARDYLSG
jgi:hypothetical protein